MVPKNIYDGSIKTKYKTNESQEMEKWKNRENFSFNVLIGGSKEKYPFIQEMEKWKNREKISVPMC